MLGLGVRVIFSIFEQAWTPIVEGVAGFVIFFGIAWVMFYSGQWGGGDSKLLMGLGAVLGLSIAQPFQLDQFAISFLVNTFILGALYGIIWALVLSIKNYEKFKKEILNIAKQPKYRLLRRITFYAFLIWIVVLLFAPTQEWKLAATTLFVFALLTYYMFLFTKTVENVCMYKRVAPEKLTEGDWIAEEIKMKGKHICGPKDLGIEQHQIDKLIAFKKKKLLKTVLIKEGIPFVPSFFLGFLATVVWGNLLILIL